MLSLILSLSLSLSYIFLPEVATILPADLLPSFSKISAPAMEIGSFSNGDCSDAAGVDVDAAFEEDFCSALRRGLKVANERLVAARVAKTDNVGCVRVANMRVGSLARK